MPFETDVFVNCPFDHDYAPLLEAMPFCLVHSGMNPRLATERLENGENRLEKIYGLACGAKYSVHDLSRCQAVAAGDYARMNMPFELGMDLGIRRATGHGGRPMSGALQPGPDALRDRPLGGFWFRVWGVLNRASPSLIHFMVAVAANRYRFRHESG